MLNPIVLAFFVSLFVLVNTLKLIVLVQNYRKKRRFFASMENEAFKLVVDGMPELVFGMFW